jgi:hypothetical protein
MKKVDDNIKASVKELKKFLRQSNVEYDKVEVDRQTVVKFKDGFYMTHRGSYTEGLSSIVPSPIIYKKIQNLISEVNLAHEFSNRSLQYEKQKLNNLLIKMDRTIRTKNLDVRFVRNNSFGGYTASRNEVVLYDPNNETIEQYLKIVPGINYHEVGHTLYTASFRRLRNDVLETYKRFDPEFEDILDGIVGLKKRKEKEDSIVGAMLRLVNAFEDGRMENLMSIRLPTALPYFKSTIYEFLHKGMVERFDNGDPVGPMDCVLIASRKYLDYDIRKWIFDKYLENEDVDVEKAKRLNGYINTFVTMSWKNNRQEMLDLVIGFFMEFLKEEFEKQQEEQEKWEEMMKELLKQLGSELNEMSDDNIDESEDSMMQQLKSQMKGEGSETKDGNPNSEGGNDGRDSQDKNGDVKKDNNDYGDAEDTKEEGKGKGKSDKEIKDKIKNDAEKSDKEINKNGEQLKGKLKKSSLNAGKGGSGENYRSTDKLVDNQMKQREKALEKKLKEFTRKCRNGYDTKKKKGTVDIGEARRQQRSGGLRVFKQYRRNVRKALDIDVAFLLDCSYSMQGSKIRNASKQLWIASQACASVGAKVKIFTFSDGDLGTVTQPKGGKYADLSPCGGTTISPSLYLAENYLNVSEATNKWCINLTDGAISDPDEHLQLIKRMQRDGITVGKINLYETSDWDSPTYDYDHVYDHVLAMENDNTSSGDIVTFFQKIYDVSMQRIGNVV